jgi:hypothetical protein
MDGWMKGLGLNDIHEGPRQDKTWTEMGRMACILVWRWISLLETNEKKRWMVGWMDGMEELVRILCGCFSQMSDGVYRLGTIIFGMAGRQGKPFFVA